MNGLSFESILATLGEKIQELWSDIAQNGCGEKAAENKGHIAWFNLRKMKKILIGYIFYASILSQN